MPNNNFKESEKRKIPGSILGWDSFFIQVCGNPSDGFCVILLTNQPTNQPIKQQIEKGKVITANTDVMKKCSKYWHLRGPTQQTFCLKNDFKN